MHIAIARSGALALVFALCVLPHTSFAAISSNLKHGSRGAEVTELQEFLIAKGLLVPPATGGFFGLTKKAVIAYQISIGLPATGFVGPLTRAAIIIDRAFFSVPKTYATSTSLSMPYVTPPTARTELAFDAKWKDAVVNLFCTHRYGGTDDITSGSGVIIDPRGVILTNAHVASSFLFADWPTPSLYQCSVRIGSPAAATYKATLLYIPDAWMQETISSLYSPTNDNVIYGQHDYALLVITGRTNDGSGPMPAAFPYMPPTISTEPAAQAPVYLIGYAASFLGGVIAQKSLYQLASPAFVHQVKSIGTSTLHDTLSFVGNIAGQHGSSGGAVVTDGGNLSGLITFFDSDFGYATSERVVNAITTSYISRDLKQLTGSDLSQFLSKVDLIGAAKDFMETKGAEYHREYTNLWRAKQGFTPPGVY